MSNPMLRLFDGSDDSSPELKPDVKTLQGLLNNFGFNLEISGVFASETEAAVRQFQMDHNLYVDGVVGAATWSALHGETSPPDHASTLPTTISSTDGSMLAQFAEAAKYQSVIVNVAPEFNLETAIIAGIGSRESGWGLALKPSGPKGTGDFAPRKFPTASRTAALPPDGGGFGRGLMQIDFDAFEFARTGKWDDPQENISFACKVLNDNVALLSRKTELKDRALLQASIAAYNCGAGNVIQAVRDGRDVDFYTTKRNYSADVFNRAGFFQARGWS